MEDALFELWGDEGGELGLGPDSSPSPSWSSGPPSGGDRYPGLSKVRVGGGAHRRCAAHDGLTRFYTAALLCRRRWRA